jgi:diaminopimelate decarboxylase
MLLTEWHRVLPLQKKSGNERHYTVLGTLPSALDQVAHSVTLPEMEQGDRIAVLDTGAYFLPMSPRFSGPLPPIVWIDDNKMVLAREGENIEDLYSVLG